MKIRKSIFIGFIPISLLILLMPIMTGCWEDDERVCCSEKGGITLDFSSLPAGPLVLFTVNGVDGVRIFDTVKRIGTPASLGCFGGEEVPPGSGNWEDAAVMLLFHKLPCNVCKITAEVHGHGPGSRMTATQLDGSTQTAVCPGNRRVLTLNAAPDNPFIYAVLSGQEAEWLSVKLD